MLLQMIEATSIMFRSSAVTTKYLRHRFHTNLDASAHRSVPPGESSTLWLDETSRRIGAGDFG